MKKVVQSTFVAAVIIAVLVIGAVSCDNGTTTAGWSHPGDRENADY